MSKAPAPAPVKQVMSVVLSVVSEDAHVPECMDVFALPGSHADAPRFKKFGTALFSVCDCTPSTLICQVILLERLMVKAKLVSISAQVVHLLWLTSLVVAQKIVSDRPYSNMVFAKLCDVDLQTLNEIERRFIQLLNWDFFVSEEEYVRVSEAIQSISAPQLQVRGVRGRAPRSPTATPQPPQGAGGRKAPRQPAAPSRSSSAHSRGSFARRKYSAAAGPAACAAVPATAVVA